MENFYEYQVRSKQQLFNQTFGSEPLCNISLRLKVILSICRLNILCKVINNSKTDNDNEEDIREFVMINDVLKRIFMKLNCELEKRKETYHVELTNISTTQPNT